ncbi:hypothetical protein EVAR_46011_1 [Eumeta japonica]|uniref:Uncharacterized protein n=1 Tax=Eumeta variegata TaxID=151549 RepID=A0A4C1X8Z8_EUMVA|nr:hypothetical protein EVAR_46011_1 [Eumeta japonica]
MECINIEKHKAVVPFYVKGAESWNWANEPETAPAAPPGAATALLPSNNIFMMGKRKPTPAVRYKTDSAIFVEASPAPLLETPIYRLTWELSPRHSICINPDDRLHVLFANV